MSKLKIAIVISTTRAARGQAAISERRIYRPIDGDQHINVQRNSILR